MIYKLCVLCWLYLYSLSTFARSNKKCYRTVCLHSTHHVWEEKKGLNKDYVEELKRRDYSGNKNRRRSIILKCILKEKNVKTVDGININRYRIQEELFVTPKQIIVSHSLCQNFFQKDMTRSSLKTNCLDRSA
jgi:hypothetical protein